MTRGLFEYPAQARFGRSVPKNRIHAHGKPSRRVKDRLTAEVAQILWACKLAPETVNLPARPDVPEIQVFRIQLKPGIEDISEDVLRCIDRAIPSPILFELDRGAHLRTIAAYKRPSEADKAKWVISDYFATDWLPADTPRQPLPVAVDLASLYHRLLRELVDIPAREAEPMQALVDRVGQIRQLQRQCEQLEAKRNREKQFNHKVEINAQLRAAREQLARLRQET